MRAFGLEKKRHSPAIKAPASLLLSERLTVAGAAPNLPARKAVSDQPVIEVLPPFGTNPPSGPLVTADGNLSDRLVNSDPRELWYLSLPSKLSPKQVLQILRSALGGDIWQQWQLHKLMSDSWPMYRKCSHELFEPVSNAEFKVRPYVPEGGDEASPLAKEKADLISRSVANFAPNQFSDEKGWNGFLYNMCDAVLNGLAISELIWYPPTDWGSGIERLPRATAWTHPRHYTFTNDGLIALYDRDYNRLTFPLAGSPSVAAPDPRKFLCAQFLSGAGSSLGAGFMRPLAWYWASVVFNREWMMKTAQNYGAPFLDVVYQTGMSNDDLKKLDSEVTAGLANRFIRHVEGTTLEVTAAQSLGSDNPQRHLAEAADQACAFLLLGQEATTKTQPGAMGGKDTGKEKTKRERVEGVAKWLGTETLNNYVAAVLYANYGMNPKALLERPTIMPDFTEATDPMAQAQRDGVFLTAGVPLVAEEFYRSNNLTMPEEGDLVIKGGAAGVVFGYQAAPQDNVGAPQPIAGGVDAEGNPLPPLDPTTMLPADGSAPKKQAPPVDAPGGKKSIVPKLSKGAKQDEQDNSNDASEVPILHLDRILAKATPVELKALIPLLDAAENASHFNGEHQLLRRHLEKINNRK